MSEQLLGLVYLTIFNRCASSVEAKHPSDTAQLVDKIATELDTNDSSGAAHCAAIYMAKNTAMKNSKCNEVASPDKLTEDVKAMVQGDYKQQIFRHFMFYYVTTIWLSAQPRASQKNGAVTDSYASTGSNPAYAIAAMVVLLGFADVYSLIWHPIHNMWDLTNGYLAIAFNVVTSGVCIFWEKVSTWVTTMALCLAKIDWSNPMAWVIVFFDCFLKSILDMIKPCNTLCIIRHVEIDKLKAENKRMCMLYKKRLEELAVNVLLYEYKTIKAKQAASPNQDRMWKNTDGKKFAHYLCQPDNLHGEQMQRTIEIVKRHKPPPEEEQIGWHYFIIGFNFLLSFVLMCCLWQTTDTGSSLHQYNILDFSFTQKDGPIDTCAPFAKLNNGNCCQYWRELTRFVCSEWWFYNLFHLNTKCAEEVCSIHRLSLQKVDVVQIYIPLICWFAQHNASYIKFS